MKVTLNGYVCIWGQDGVETTGDVQSFFAEKVLLTKRQEEKYGWEFIENIYINKKNEKLYKLSLL